MPAKTKQELIATTEIEFGKLLKVLEGLPARLRMERDADETSPKDIVGHRAHWIQLFQTWFREGRDGKEVFFPAKGYKWNELKRYNADVRQHQSGLSWQAARSLLECNHAELLALVESLSDDDLYGAPMTGANNNWTTGRWAEAAGASHYRSACKYLRQRIRTFNAARSGEAAA